MRKRKIHLAQFTRKFARTQICTIAALFLVTWYAWIRANLMRTHTRRRVRISRVHERMGPGRICVRARSKLIQSRVNVYMFTCDIHQQGIFKQNLQKFMVKIFKTHVVTSNQDKYQRHLHKYRNTCIHEQLWTKSRALRFHFHNSFVSYSC